MLFAFWCVLIAALMPIAFAGYAKFSGQRRMGPKENANPREWLDGLEGEKKRAHWAQLNSYEAFPPFAAGVVIAAIAGASAAAINTLAILFVLIRIAYGVCYIKDMASLRSVVWTLGLLCVIGLFIAAGLA